MKENLTEFVQALSGRQLAAERSMSELAAQIKALEARIAELSQLLASQTAAAAATLQAAQNGPEKAAKAAITPEILVMLAAAATAYLGKEVRVRSARMLQTSYEAVNPWTQQGRVLNQASRYPRLRR